MSSYRDEIAARAARAAKEEVAFLAAASARAVAKLDRHIERSRTRDDLRSVLGEKALIADLDAAATAAFYERWASAFIQATDSVSYRREAHFWGTLDDSLLLIAVIGFVTALYFWHLFTTGATGSAVSMRPEDVIFAPGRGMAVWAAVNVSISLLPGWIVNLTWIVGLILIIRKYGFKLTHIATILIVPLSVPALFMFAWLLTIESRIAAFNAGEQSMYAKIYASTTNPDTRRWVELSAPKPIPYQQKTN